MTKTAGEIAYNQIARKGLMPNLLTSKQLQALPAHVKNASVFSAKVYQAEVLSKTKDLVGKIANGEMDRATARALLKSELTRIDYEPNAKDKGTIKDLRTDRRLNLIIDTNVEMARGYGSYIAGMTDTALALFPAQELIRVGAMPVAPRPWRQKWLDHGGRYIQGKMIAAKTDPIWTAISRFGNPYPPFDYNSGMRLKMVRQDEAEGMGMQLDPEASRPAHLPNFGEKIQAGSAGLSPQFIAAMKKHFGDLVQFSEDGKVVRNDIEHLEQLYERAALRVSGEKFKDKLKPISLGQAAGEIATLSKDAGYDITGMELQIWEDDIKHALSRHGVGKEKFDDQRPITKADFLYIMLNWRNPAIVGAGNKENSLGFELTFNGILYVFYVDRHKNNKLRFNTMYAKKQ